MNLKTVKLFRKDGSFIKEEKLLFDMPYPKAILVNKQLYLHLHYDKYIETEIEHSRLTELLVIENVKNESNNSNI